MDLSEIRASRARDYVASKRAFHAGLVELLDHLRAAGRAPAADPGAAEIDRLIATSTEAFLNDPDAHYESVDFFRYGAGIDREQGLLNWEAQGILPRGFSEKGLSQYSLVQTNRTRYQHPDHSDQDCQFGTNTRIPAAVAATPETAAAGSIPRAALTDRMRRSLLRRWLPALLLIALFLTLAYVRRDMHQRYGFTLATVLAADDPPIAHRIRLTVRGETRDAVAGKWPPAWLGASGPPVAIVDIPTQLIVDTTLDIGDDLSFRKRWPGVEALLRAK
jgi:hypothetical protein